MRLLSALLPLLGSSPAEAIPVTAPPSAPPIRVWMSNDGRFREGDYARVQVDAEADGYLLVLQHDAFGRLRVLFPLDPRDDNRVRAGRRYEVRGEDGRYAFRADGDGPGLIYSAISPDPWRLDEVVLDGRWDYERLSIDRRSEDPEPEITELVQRLAGPAGFDYDILDYRVYGTTPASTTVVYRDYGYGYDPYRYCDWFWSYSGCGSFRLGIHYGYDPYYYDRYYYGYPSRRYYGGYSYYPRVPIVTVPRAPRAVVTGRPRANTVVPVRPRGFGSDRLDRSPGSGSRINPPAIDSRSRGVTRPRPTSDRSVAPGSRPERWNAPQARPARPPEARRESRGENRDRGEARSGNPGTRSQPGARPAPQRNSGGKGGGQIRGNSGGSGGQASRPPAPSRPRRP